LKLSYDKIRNKDAAKRIVVFIDDLDRCSPLKTLEVFESIKVFLGIVGIIYVIGLSHETVSKLISLQYGASGITGEQYVKKMIQIPISLPKWNSYDIVALIQNLIKKGITAKYKEIIADNKYLISEAVENNPREVKRFINNFIVSYEIFSKHKNINPTELLVVQTLILRWSNFFYELLASGQPLLKEAKKYFNMNQIQREIELQSTSAERNECQVSLRHLNLEENAWDFIKNHEKIIFGITNWELYRRAVQPLLHEDYYFGQEHLHDIINLHTLTAKINSGA
jgi:predicted KAP-like P-loop ATPase